MMLSLFRRMADCPSTHEKHLLIAMNPPLIGNPAALRLVAINIAAEGSVGTRFIKRRGISAAQGKRESRALASILCAVVLPLVLAFVLVALNMRSDLSDLMPAEALPDGSAALIGWQDLEVPDGKAVSLEQTRSQPERRVRMLGYMMDSYGMDGRTPSPDGAPVRMFVLMPEAGHILHPAHRIPDQMVEVWPASPVPFRFRSLVWSTGSLERIRGPRGWHDERPQGRQKESPLYTMANADVLPAVDSDITLWFKP
jgi:hypothetical protein